MYQGIATPSGMPGSGSATLSQGKNGNVVGRSGMSARPGPIGNCRAGGEAGGAVAANPRHPGGSVPVGKGGPVAIVPVAARKPWAKFRVSATIMPTGLVYAQLFQLNGVGRPNLPTDLLVYSSTLVGIIHNDKP